jgi:hypothetical protein
LGKFLSGITSNIKAKILVLSLFNSVRTQRYQSETPHLICAAEGRMLEAISDKVPLQMSVGEMRNVYNIFVGRLEGKRPQYMYICIKLLASYKNVSYTSPSEH